MLKSKCDDIQTLLSIINELYEELIVPKKKKKRVLLEGDQVTYERLQCIKAEYGNDFSRRLALPEKLPGGDCV